MGAETVRVDPDEVPNRCTTFEPVSPDDHIDLAEDETLFAFVCPRCEAENTLRGNPNDFRTKPFRCVECEYVSLLDGDAIGTFVDSIDASFP